MSVNTTEPEHCASLCCSPAHGSCFPAGMGTALAVQAQMCGTIRITRLCCTLATCLTPQQVGCNLYSAHRQILACMAEPLRQPMQHVANQTWADPRSVAPLFLVPPWMALSLKLAVLQTCPMCCTMGCSTGWRRRAGSLTSTGTRSSTRWCARPGSPRLKGQTRRRACSPSLPGPQP